MLCHAETPVTLHASSAVGTWNNEHTKPEGCIFAYTLFHIRMCGESWVCSPAGKSSLAGYQGRLGWQGPRLIKYCLWLLFNNGRFPGSQSGASQSLAWLVLYVPTFSFCVRVRIALSNRWYVFWVKSFAKLTSAVRDSLTSTISVPWVFCDRSVAHLKSLVKNSKEPTHTQIPPSSSSMLL